MSAAPYDESNIAASDLVIRRVDPEQHIIEDKNRGCRRISSLLYSKSSGDNEGMSVDIEALIVTDGRDPVQWVTTPKYTGSVAFTAESIRELNLQVGYDPIDENPFHGEVWLKSSGKRFSKAQKDGLAKCATWYVEIPGIELS